MKVRLKDVAARAGVAVNTASTILNRRPNSWASKETEARVFAAAEELGYRPNRAALGLRFGRFNTLGLLIPDLHNPFYTAFADMMEVEAELRGYDLIVESWRTDLAREKHCLDDMLDRQVDGVASFLSDSETHRDFLAAQFAKKRPFVALSAAGAPRLACDSVLVDFSQGLRDAVEALCRRGHQRFAFLCALAEGQNDGGRHDRLREFLLERGLPESAFVYVRCGASLESACAAAARLFADQSSPVPTALIALNDLSAIGAMRAAAERRLAVPADLSIVGVDDIPLGRFLPVTLSTIALPIAEMARRTVQLLTARIDNPENEKSEETVFTAQFIERESIGPASQR